MNPQLQEVLEEVRALPDERQHQVAQIVLAFLDQQNPGLYLLPEEVAEVECRAAEDGPYATNEEVRDKFALLTKYEMKLRWNANALISLQAIYAYLSQEDVAAARLFVEWVEEATARLLSVPMSGRRSAIKGIRLLAVPEAPYLIVYRVRDEIVDILMFICTEDRKPENRGEGAEIERRRRTQATRRRSTNRRAARS